MEYKTVRQMAKEWNMTIQMVRRYCQIGRIPDVVQRDGGWMIPANAENCLSKNQKQPFRLV